MSSAPPPPPPPLPSAVSHDLNTAPTPKLHYINNPATIDPDICTWALEVPQIREACSKFKICLYKEPFKYKYKHVEPILQIGPTCGLVALSMAIQGAVPPEEILRIAKNEGYTCQGEMLSCRNLVKLAEKVLSLAEINAKLHLKVDNLCSQDTVDRLLDGAVLLVPYDADCNHSPCQRKGHTAHWALITGVIITGHPGLQGTGVIITGHPGSQGTGVIITPSGHPGASTTNLDDVHVFARHGKSKYLAVWKLADLDKSNRNLQEFSPKKEVDGFPYVMPEGGMGGLEGLRNQFVMIEGL